MNACYYNQCLCMSLNKYWNICFILLSFWSKSVPASCFVCICIIFLCVCLCSRLRHSAIWYPDGLAVAPHWDLLQSSERWPISSTALLWIRLPHECMLLAELGSGLLKKRDQTGLSDERNGANTEIESCYCAARIKMWKLLDKCRNM